MVLTSVNYYENIDLLIGDATKARKQLNWEPTIDFPTLVSIMVEADLAILGLPPQNPEMSKLYEADHAYIRQASGGMVD